MQDQHRLSRITVKAQINIIHADIAVGKADQQAVQASDLVLHLHAENVVGTAQIAVCGQRPQRLFRVGDDHPHDAVLGAVIGDGAEDIDIFVLKNSRYRLEGSSLVFCKD